MIELENSSIMNDFQLQQETSKSSPIALRDQIIHFQRTQTELKNYITQMEVAIKSPFMSFRQDILQNHINKQVQKYKQLLVMYRNFEHKDQRIYCNMMVKLKQKIISHIQQFEEVFERPDEHFQKLKQQNMALRFQNQNGLQPQWKFIIRGVAGILGAFCLHLLVGAINRLAMINPFLSSYFKMRSDPYLQIQDDTIGGPLIMFCAGITMKWGFRKCQQYGSVLIMSIASFFAFLSILTASFMQDFFWFLLFHNVLYGMSVGFLFIAPMKQCHKYFPEYQLLCNAIILVGSGLGSILFGVFNTQCINPTHQKSFKGWYTGPVDYIGFRFPECIFKMSILVLAIGASGCFLLYFMCSYNQQQAKNKLSFSKQKQYFQNKCFNQEQALKSNLFWIIAIIIILSTLGNFYFPMNYRSIVKAEQADLLHDQNFLYLVVLSGSFFNGFFRIIWGLIFKKIGLKLTFSLISVSNIITYLMFICLNVNEDVYLLTFTLAGINLGGLFVIFPNTCLLVYGDIIGDSIYGYYWATFSLSNLIQYFIGDNLQGIVKLMKTINSSYSPPQNVHKIVFYPFILFSFIGLVLCLLSRFQGRWQNSLNLLQLCPSAKSSK